MSASQLAIDADGAALLTLGAAASVPSRELEAAIERIACDAAIKAVIITSTPGTGFVFDPASAEMACACDGESALQAYARSQRFSTLLRRLETCGKPVAAAIDGSAISFGFELALACHYRVLADDPAAELAMPEVKVGLLPAAGGTQRLPRVIGISKALPVLLHGSAVQPAEALKVGLVHALATRERLLSVARDWVRSNPQPLQPWDVKSYAVPGGVGCLASHAWTSFGVGTSLIARDTARNYPAPLAIAAAVFEGTIVPIESGLRIESKYFAKLASDPVSRNLMRLTHAFRGRTSAGRYSFLPVERMPLVSHDSPASFTSRVLGAYIAEGVLMLAEGIEPALIENAARMAGMALGPLAIADAVTIEVSERTAAKASSMRPQSAEAMRVMRTMLELGRSGRHSGKGFYDYDGAAKRLWKGLRERFSPAEAQMDVRTLMDRFLSIQALESARCFEEGVITQAADGDLDSVLAVGYPAWTGGALSYIDTMGAARFVERCRELAQRCGARFAPSDWLIARARRGESFHAMRDAA